MTTTYYSVVRAVPDPVSGEFVNIGVVVFGDGKVRTEFLSDWRRVECLANEDISYLHEFVLEFEREARETMAGANWPSLQQLPATPPFGEDEFVRIAADWGNSIQFSPIEVANLAPEVALPEIASIFLKEAPPQRRRARDARHAGQVADHEITAAFERVLGSTRTKNVVKHRAKLAGKRYDKNRVDVAIANGYPYLVGKGLSFEIESTDQIEHQVSLTVLQLGDLRDLYNDLAIAIITVPPSEVNGTGHRSRILYRDLARYASNLNAEIVEEKDAADWAAEEANRLRPRFEYATLVPSSLLGEGNVRDG